MTDIVLEREYEPPMSPADFAAMARGSNCMSLHGVDWEESFLSEDGHRLICRFTGPDMEAARNGLRQQGEDCLALWPGNVHDMGIDASMNVVVERQFEQPTQLEEIQAIEDAGASCLEMHRVTFICTFFSRDQTRMICIYSAPDAESVRLAQREANMPFERVWACRHMTMDSLEP